MQGLSRLHSTTCIGDLAGREPDCRGWLDAMQLCCWQPRRCWRQVCQRRTAAPAGSPIAPAAHRRSRPPRRRCHLGACEHSVTAKEHLHKQWIPVKHVVQSDGPHRRSSAIDGILPCPAAAQPPVSALVQGLSPLEGPDNRPGRHIQAAGAGSGAEVELGGSEHPHSVPATGWPKCC